MLRVLSPIVDRQKNADRVLDVMDLQPSIHRGRK